MFCGGAPASSILAIEAKFKRFRNRTTKIHRGSRKHTKGKGKGNAKYYARPVFWIHRTRLKHLQPVLGTSQARPQAVSRRQAFLGAQPLRSIPHATITTTLGTLGWPNSDLEFLRRTKHRVWQQSSCRHRKSATVPSRGSRLCPTAVAIRRNPRQTSATTAISMAFAR